MDNITAFGQQIALVLAVEVEVQRDRDEVAALVERWTRVNLLRLQFGSLEVDPQLILGSAFTEGFATLIEDRFAAEVRLEQHEATLWSEYDRLAGMRAAFTPQVGQVNQSQQQAAPAPPTPGPQPAGPVVNGPPAASQTAPRRQTLQKRWYCSVCLAAGVRQNWDRTGSVIKHGQRRHPGVLVVPITAPSRLRN